MSEKINRGQMDRQQMMAMSMGGSQQFGGWDGFQGSAASVAPTIQELIASGVHPSIARRFHDILTSPDFVMSRLDKNDILRLEVMFDIAIFELTFSAPPEDSIWICSMDGKERVTSEQIRNLHLVKMWFLTRIRRSKDGFERTAQQTQYQVRELIGPGMVAAKRPGLGMRIMGKLSGGGKV